MTRPTQEWADQHQARIGSNKGSAVKTSQKTSPEPNLTHSRVVIDEPWTKNLPIMPIPSRSGLGTSTAIPKGVKTPPAGQKQAQRSKHGAVKTTVNGLRFDSKLESRVYAALQLRQAAGEIRNLRRQVRFSLFAPGGEHLGVYVADFVYEEPYKPYPHAGRWIRVVADAKSDHTRKLPGWNRTKTLMRACHSITVLELP